MRNCINCDKKTIKAERYTGEQYKDKCFCSKECYDIYVKDHYENSISIVRDTIQRWYSKDLDLEKPFDDEYNYDEVKQEQADRTALTPWQLITRQIKIIKDKHELTYKEMAEVIQYAKECDGYIMKHNRVLMNGIFPKYLDEYREFMADLEKRKNMEIPEQSYIYVKGNGKKKPYIDPHNLEWTEEDEKETPYIKKVITTTTTTTTTTYFDPHNAEWTERD